MTEAKVNQKYLWADGGKYYGEMNENGVAHGYGLRLSTKDDFYYEGEFADSKFSGKGGVFWFGVLEYYGDFLNGDLHGYGI